MKKLWLGFAAVIVLSFSVLGWIGVRIYQEAPPIPQEVVSTDGSVVIPAGDIGKGQNVWQALGGMEVGSVWGHGSYVAPDWTADWLHRECVFLLDEWAKTDFGAPYDGLDVERQAGLRARLEKTLRTNAYDPASGRLTIDPARAKAFASNAAHYADIFTRGKEEYAIHAGAQSDPEKLRQLSAFFFWSSWAASTARTGRRCRGPAARASAATRPGPRRSARRGRGRTAARRTRPRPRASPSAR